MTNEIYNVEINNATITFKSAGMGKTYTEIICKAKDNKALLDTLPNLDYEDNENGTYRAYKFYPQENNDKNWVEIYIYGIE